MRIRLAMMFLVLGSVLAGCGRDCPIGANYYDAACPNYIPNGQFQQPYTQQYPPYPGQYPGQFPGQFPQQYQGQFPGQYPQGQYNYPCPPNNPYCYPR